ncbi:MAG TPA: YfiR family protein [Candidatus Sulfotelmatobacter sp.]|nr:YfiR family protein [Candidatus Sulfotelmatobacter sp.]
MATVSIAADSQCRPLSRRRLFWKCVRSLIVLAPLAAGSHDLAAQQQPSESQIKAAYLYNFGKFVTWPPGQATNQDLFVICILGKDPFREVLDATVRGESIGKKQITVRRLSRMPDAAGCNILFISSSEQSRLGQILADAQRMHLLTVSDMTHFAERGGVIGLVTQQDRVRFEVNRQAAEQSHLALSSELLKVAVRVIASKAER